MWCSAWNFNAIALERKPDDTTATLVRAGLVASRWGIARIGFQHIQAVDMFSYLPEVSAVRESLLHDPRWQNISSNSLVYEHNDWLASPKRKSDFEEDIRRRAAGTPRKDCNHTVAAAEVLQEF